jgi:hypothetical protein
MYKSLVCLLLVSCCVAARVGKGDGNADWNAMKAWLTSEGAFIHDGIEGGKMMPHGGYEIRSMVATTAFPDVTTLLTIPRDVAIETRNHPEIHNAPLKDLRGCKMLEETYVEEVRLAGIIAIETQKGSQSKYSMYLQQLPSLADYQSFHPRFMEATLREEFAELPVVRGAKEQQARDVKFKQCFQDWKDMSGSPVAMLSWQELLLGLTHLQNRMISAQGSWFMIPGMDLVNTDPRRVNTQWQLVHLGAEKGEHFALSGYAIEPGQEVFVDYCSDCDNQDMLLKWGVYLEDNPNELEYEHASVHCAAKPEGNSTGVLSFREVTESLLNMKDLDNAREAGWRSPRCDSQKLGAAQSGLRCSMARLAFESCVDQWRPGFKRESQGFQLPNPWNWVNKTGERLHHPPRAIQMTNTSSLPKSTHAGKRRSSPTQRFLKASSSQR